MSRTKTATSGLLPNVARDFEKPDEEFTGKSPRHSTASLLHAVALALPIGVGGFIVTPSGGWFDLWRESADLARARRVTEDEVSAGLLEEARFLEAEPLGRPA